MMQWLAVCRRSPWSRRLIMFALPGSTCNGRGQGGMHHQRGLRIRRQRTYTAQALTRHVVQRRRRMTIRIVRKGIALSMALWVVMATSWALPGPTEARQVRNNTRTSVNRNVNRNVNVNRSRNVNVNRNVNVHRDIDIDVDRHYHGYHPVATAVGVAAAATVTAAVVGSIVYFPAPRLLSRRGQRSDLSAMRGYLVPAAVRGDAGQLCRGQRPVRPPWERLLMSCRSSAPGSWRR